MHGVPSRSISRCRRSTDADYYATGASGNQQAELFQRCNESNNNNNCNNDDSSRATKDQQVSAKVQPLAQPTPVGLLIDGISISIRLSGFLFGSRAGRRRRGCDLVSAAAGMSATIALAPVCFVRRPHRLTCIMLVEAMSCAPLLQPHAFRASESISPRV